MSTENIRLALLGALLFFTFLLWNAWEKDYPAQKVATSAATVVASPENVEASSALPSKIEKTVRVKTDVLDVVVDLQGGNVVGAQLPAYPTSLQTPHEPFTLLSPESNRWYVAESALMSSRGPDLPQHPARYTAASENYVLNSDHDELRVPLIWNENGVKVTKTLKFLRGSYLIQEEYQIENLSDKPWMGYFTAQLQRKNLPQTGGGFFRINPYVGAAFSSPDDRYQKVSFDKMKDHTYDKVAQNGWAAILQHYFLTAWIPDPQQMFRYQTETGPDDIYNVRVVGNAFSVAPGGMAHLSAKLYVGPALVDVLKNIAPGLDLTVDYGMLWFFASAIFWVMKKINDVVHNWGWSIVLVTVLIKLLFYHLSAASYRSMAAMKRIQPRMKAIQERYANDKQKLSQEMMDLYKKEKVNPFGGCLPVVIQIPVFIALYWVLIESIQLRQAPFILWIRDLSVADPYYILPIIMGISIFLQQKMNPPPADPTQAKIMLFLPVVFTGLFLTFPAGLVLYWVVNTLLSILQQWYVMSAIEKQDAARKLKR